MKYVILRHKITGYFHPLVFDEGIVHREAVGTLCRASGDFRPFSAGFLYPKDGVWHVRGKSESLRLGPNKDDQMMLSLFMTQGIAGLALANVMLMNELERLKGVDTSNE